MIDQPASRDIRQLMNPDAIRGQVALITGAGSGLGRAIAVDLARLGANVALSGRRVEPLQATAESVREAGSRALVLATDIRDPDQVSAMVDGTIAEFGRIDVLVNNAGGQFTAPAEEIGIKGWRAVHRLAVEATWNVTHQVATSSMIPNRSGVIFFIAFSPRRGIPGMVHASSARAATENLAAGLALEWSRYGIRSVCVAPGTIATEGLHENYGEAECAAWAQAVPLGRLGVAADVSGVIGFLASAGGAYITGTTIVVDGGADAWGQGYAAPAPEAQPPQDPER
jgi:citronellol/citronellal dehydrogenase